MFYQSLWTVCQEILLLFNIHACVTCMWLPREEGHARWVIHVESALRCLFFGVSRKLKALKVPWCSILVSTAWRPLLPSLSLQFSEFRSRCACCYRGVLSFTCTKLDVETHSCPFLSPPSIRHILLMPVPMYLPYRPVNHSTYWSKYIPMYRWILMWCIYSQQISLTLTLTL